MSDYAQDEAPGASIQTSRFPAPFSGAEGRLAKLTPPL